LAKQSHLFSDVDVDRINWDGMNQN